MKGIAAEVSRRTLEPLERRRRRPLLLKALAKIGVTRCSPPPVIQELTGERLHLSHGPIDVVLKAWGQPEAVRAAYAAAGRRVPGDPARAVRRAAHAAPADAGGTHARRARGAAHGRGLPALRRRVRHADGGGRGRRCRRAAGAHDRRGAARARLRQRRRRHRRAGHARARRWTLASPASSRAAPCRDQRRRAPGCRPRASAASPRRARAGAPSRWASPMR